MTVPIDALRDSELFAGLKDDELALVGSVARSARVPAGTRVFGLGEAAQSVLLVQSGTVALTLPVVLRGETRDVTLEEKSDGAVLAWSALVPPYKLTLGATARTETVLVQLERTALERLFAERPALQARISMNLNTVIAGRFAILEALVIRDLQRRVETSA